MEAMNEEIETALLQGKIKSLIEKKINQNNKWWGLFFLGYSLVVIGFYCLNK